jgi:hypothetical protein
MGTLTHSDAFPCPKCGAMLVPEVQNYCHVCGWELSNEPDGRKPIYVVVSWWIDPSLYPENIVIEVDEEGRTMTFKSREEAEAWAKKNLQAGMWKVLKL